MGWKIKIKHSGCPYRYNLSGNGNALCGLRSDGIKYGRNQRCTGTNCPIVATSNKLKVSDYFSKLRFDKNHHLGMGDIRLTIAQQEEIVEFFNP